MDWKFVFATSVMLVINLIYAVVALFVGVGALHLLDRVLLKKVDLEEEIQKGNVAAGIFAGTLLLFVAIIVGLALAK
ncbi:MAG: DUF350 domain-containing protein [Planctomycetes bacterium]|nr:DUF350 domain-containing protein [Planctomycetota bacterium]